MSKLFAAFLLLVVLVVPGNSFADADGAKNYVLGVSDKVISVIKNKGSESEKEAQLTSIFQNTVDTEWMGTFVMGKNYRSMTPAQKSRYTELYKKFLTKSYVPKFRSYAGEELKILEVKSKGDGEYIVYTELKAKSADVPAVKVDYRVTGKNGGYKVIDVIGEGVSLITTQRSDFSGLISQQGVDYFLDKLDEKVKKTSAAKK